MEGRALPPPDYKMQIIIIGMLNHSLSIIYKKKVTLE